MKFKVLIFVFFSVVMFNLMTMTVHAESGVSDNDKSVVYQYYFNYTTALNNGSPRYCFTEKTYIASERLCFVINGKTTVLDSVFHDTEVDCIFLLYHGGENNSNLLGFNSEISEVYKSQNGTVISESSRKSSEYAHPYPYVSAQTIGHRGSGYYDLDTNIPIFSNFEDVEHYFLTGDTSAAVNGQSFNGDVYDDTMPGVTNFSVKGMSENECHLKFENCAGCIHLSWGTPDGYEYSDTYEIKFLLKYNYTTAWGTKRYYGSKMVELSDVDSSLVYIHDFGVDLCAYELGKKLDLPVKNENDYVSSFHIQEVQKIFIRANRRENGKIHYGDWYIYNCENKTLSWDSKYEHVRDGTIVSGDAILDGDGNVIDDELVKDTIPAPEEDEKGNFLFGIDFSNVGGVLSGFYTIIQNLMAAIGFFPSLFATVFCFLPTEITSSILLVFYMAIIVGILKIFT